MSLYGAFDTTKDFDEFGTGQVRGGAAVSPATMRQNALRNLLNSTTITILAVDRLLQGAATGSGIISGTFTPTAGTGTETVTGMTTVVRVILQMQDIDLTHMWTTADPSGGTAGQFTWAADKPTTATDVTPIAATTPWNVVDYIAFGTF